MVVVAVVGGGPGLYVDLATLSFHTPTCESCCAKAGEASAAENPRHTRAETHDRLTSFIRLLLSGRVATLYALHLPGRSESRTVRRRAFSHHASQTGDSGSHHRVVNMSEPIPDPPREKLLNRRSTDESVREQRSKSDKLLREERATTDE